MAESKGMSIKEVAEYLKVSDAVIKEMIKAKTLKKTGIAANVKIQKADVDEWLAGLNENEVENLSMKRVICHFQDYFKLENIFMDFEADNKYEAIGIMSKKAKELGIVKDHKWLYEIVVAREELVSTAVGKGVAMLHPRQMHPIKITRPSVMFGRTIEPVEFDAPDDKPVNLFFMLLLHNDKQHLFSLSFISKFLMNEGNIDILTKAKTEQDVYKAIIGTEAK